MTAQASSRWQWVSHALRTIPVDLLLVLGSVWLVAVGVHTQVTGRFGQFLLGSFVLFFAPGYVLVAALFPGAGTETSRQARSVSDSLSGPLTLGERLVLSFGASVALIPVLGLALALASLPYSLTVVTSTLAVLATLGAVIAWLRRIRLPRERRFGLALGKWGRDLYAFLAGGSSITSAVNIILAVSILVALGAVTYAVAVPQPSPGHTNFGLVTQNETTGEYVSSGYPTNMTQNEPADLVVQIENQHRESREYTVVAELQQVRTGDERIEVLTEREVARFQVEAESGETVHRPHTIQPQQAGDDLRLAYYFYRGEAPENPSAATADENLYLWTNVSATP